VHDGPHIPALQVGWGEAFWSFFAAHPKQ
jgi:hypothetical protein